MPISDIDTLSYEEARDELLRVVNELEQGNTALEESISLWERGEALARHCEERLIGAKARLGAARSGAASASSDPVSADSPDAGTASAGPASAGPASE